MGYYEGEHEHPCPRCGGVVRTLFISVAPMYFERCCLGCGVTDFTATEEAQLGANVVSSRATTPTPTTEEPTHVSEESPDE